MKNKNLKKVEALIDPELYEEAKFLSKKTGYSIAVLLRWGLGGIITDHRSRGDFEGFKGGNS